VALDTGVGPREVHEHRFTRIPDRRMPGADHTHVVDSIAVGEKARERGRDDEGITMGQQRHEILLATLTFVTVVVTK
jgi:hypothetical protein